MEIELHVIGTIVGIVGTMGFILHRMKVEQTKIVEWRTKLEAKVEFLDKELSKYDERLKRHGVENDKISDTVNSIKSDLAVLSDRLHRDMENVKEVLQKIQKNGHG